MKVLSAASCLGDESVVFLAGNVGVACGLGMLMVKGVGGSTLSWIEVSSD